MKLAIIADDLTGANDTGVQLARNGMKTSVFLQMNQALKMERDAFVFDTDSRAMSKEQAYQKIKEVAEFIKQADIDILYKKMDSTMRGNIGAEIDAVYDVFQPDFVMIAPAYPQNNRQVKDGFLYLNCQLLHKSEVSLDPKTPVTESYLPDLLQKQTVREIGLINYRDIEKGTDHLNQLLDQYYHGNIPYVIFDALEDDHLQQIATLINQTSYRTIWAGSAGLANFLPTTKKVDRSRRTETMDIPHHISSVLFVVGSVSVSSRRQLDKVLEQSDVQGIMLQSDLVIADDQTRENELNRVCAEAGKLLQSVPHIAIYSSATVEDIDKANVKGRSIGLDSAMVSNQISRALGDVSNRLMKKYPIEGLVMTGGDTAKQVCLHNRFVEFELIDEIESGIPFGKLRGQKDYFAITKAGNFGTDDTLIHALNLLKGEKLYATNHRYNNG